MEFKLYKIIQVDFNKKDCINLICNNKNKANFIEKLPYLVISVYFCSVKVQKNSPYESDF